ncbi:hypothetical protein D6D22_02947 [Aureobasidium pullulans]|uniref:RING-type domain-containing protein n=1 Tax=Aureobasidium pullulans TaxID=5580 RepID=A0A4S8Y1L2_AURPU|nr:hypothetical protein D6D22_02947 [Aureobasidium pullulans]
MATLTHSPHALHAQTTTNPNHFHDGTSEIHSTSSTQDSSTLSAITPALMDESEDNVRERLIFAPVLAIPRMDADSDMEGADDTSGRSPIWPPPQALERGNSPAAPVASINVIDLPATDARSPIPEPLSPIPPPPPPAADLFMEGRPPPPPVLVPDGPTRSGDSGEEDDDDDDDRSHISDERAKSFYPFKEDMSEPDAEETRIMRGYVENSALDDKHWHSRTFFDLQDAEFTPKEQGKIEWTIKEFNGTKDNPRKNLLLTSHTVHIGGHDWRIKLLPHGNMQTDRLSLYVENVSIQSAEPQEWPEGSLPLPVLGEGVKVMKRKALAAQVSILVYNPEEPRVNEFRADAHQFFQDSPDHGWTRFTSVPWYEIHRRSYAQRQPLLRNDTLAVKAFIRVIDDPTGCLWTAKQSKLSVTGLNPFHSGGHEDAALYPVLALWLHLRPFRQLLYQTATKKDDNIIAALQAMLWRMRSRVGSPADNNHVPLLSEYLEDFYEDRGPQDAMQTMNDLYEDAAAYLQHLDYEDKDKVLSPRAIERLNNVFGRHQFSGERATKRSIVGKTSMQEVVDGDFPSDLKSEVLTIELERQIFDSDKRVWKKLLNKVRLDDQITIAGVTYTLYGFVAHEGHLRTGRYSSYFRPGGLKGLWYTYKNIIPTCLTRTQAVSPREGVLPAEAIEEPVITADRPVNYDRLLGQVDAVAYVVMYIRSSDAFDLAAKEPWDVPEWIPKTYGPQVIPEGAGNGAAETLHYDDAESVASDEEMNDVTEGSISEDKVIADNLKLEQVTINYLSQPFYSGTINSDNQQHGQGHLITLSGDEYTGQFENSSYSGEGTMLYANSDTYVGTWLNDLPHGHGTHTSHRTGNVYTGNWEEGKKSGAGVTHWKMSEEESKACRICFGAEADAAFYDCGHVVACLSCARRVEDCPVCRRRIRDVVRLFYMA